MSVETLQWTLLVGLLAMVVVVLWHRMRAAFVDGVAPEVAADWNGEGAVRVGPNVVLTVQVNREGAMEVSLESPSGQKIEVHTGNLTKGQHTWELLCPQSEQWVAKLTCQGHRTERKV